jgi:formamidopyrimidine-DNA glycosylase
VPELPEVETVRRDLQALVVGARVERVLATGARTVRRTSARAVVDGVTGRTLVEAHRRGKYLLVTLDSGRWLVVHLRMSGQLVLAPTSDAPLAAHTHVRLALGDGRELRFVDPRTFGEVVVVDPLALATELPGLALLGPEPLDLDAAGLGSVLTTRRRQLKALLTDQRVIAGIGNIYADEIAHAAGVRHARAGSTLSGREVGRLHDAIHRILPAAIAARGSTLSDAQYVDLGGLGGGYQEHHAVYDREGKPCLTCGRPIVRMAWAGRSTFFCRRCQR